MRAVVQRIKNGTVRVKDKITGQIDDGLLVYLGVGKNDTEKDTAYITEKIVNLRIFEDDEGRMNFSVLDTKGKILMISQFTLYGDIRRGRRPSYSDAALPEQAEALYVQCLENMRQSGIQVEAGVFGAMMDVSYTNEGPVTILIDSEKKF